MKTIYIIALILLAQCAIAAHINEVMYNPEGNDNNREFVEIYLEGNQSLEGWTVGDSASNDTLSTLFYTDSSYALIVEDGYDYENSDASYYSAGATIGNNLNNDLDEIFLYDPSGNLVDTMSYDGTIANNNGLSIEYFNGSWQESLVSGGTPGHQNSIAYHAGDDTGPIVNQTGGETNASASADINDTSVVDNSSDVIEYNGTEPQTDQTTPADDSSEENMTYFNETQDEDDVEGSCDINISIHSGKLVYEDGEKVSYKIDINDKSHPYVIEYWAEDIIGNIVKSPYNTTNTNQRTWTPDCDDGDVFFIRARIADAGCNDTEHDDDSAEIPVVVKCPLSEEDAVQQTEGIEIDEIYLGSDNSAEFGETIRVKLHITRGSTSKTAIEMYAEGDDGKISETTSMNMDSKDSEISLTAPLFIKPDCGDVLDDGDYILVVSGLGVEDSKKFRIDGHKSGFCKTVTKTVYKDSSCPDLKPVVLLKPKPKIKSFYTLAKKYSERLRLFANVECPGTCVLDLSNETQVLEKRTLENFTGKIDFNVTASRGYVLEISDIADRLNMSPGLEFPEKVQEFVLSVNNLSDAVEYTHNGITGDVAYVPETVYESSNEQTKKRIKYFLLGVVGILVVIVLFRKFS